MSTTTAMLIIGLTGGIGSGKTTVAEMFVARGAALVDTDAVAHSLTTAGGAAIEPIRAAFGEKVIAADGSLDRAAMRARVFGDAGQRRRLEAILHPMIRERTEAEVAAAQAPYVLVAVPLMTETGAWRDRAARVLVVDCPREVQAERVMARSGLRREQVEAILAAQADREARLAIADDVIDNSGDPSSLAPQVARLHARYLELSRTGD